MFRFSTTRGQADLGSEFRLILGRTNDSIVGGLEERLLEFRVRSHAAGRSRQEETNRRGDHGCSGQVHRWVQFLYLKEVLTPGKNLRAELVSSAHD